MTKLLDRVDSAATKGARKQATQSHASMLTVHSKGPTTTTTVRLKAAYGSEKSKVSVHPKPAHR
jgi:hypothetical protein